MPPFPCDDCDGQRAEKPCDTCESTGIVQRESPHTCFSCRGEHPTQRCPEILALLFADVAVVALQEAA